MSRTMEEVTKEYADICTKTGDIHFKMTLLARDIKLLEERVIHLNNEAAEINKEKAGNSNE